MTKTKKPKLRSVAGKFAIMRRRPVTTAVQRLPNCKGSKSNKCKFLHVMMSKETTKKAPTYDTSSSNALEK